MSFLENLELSTAPSAAALDPNVAAKNTLLTYLDKQLGAAEGFAKGEAIELTERTRWFKEDEDGVTHFQIRVCNKPLELKKDKSYIVVGDKAKLPKVIKDIIQATKNGEFNKMIEKIVKEKTKAS